MIFAIPLLLAILYRIRGGVPWNPIHGTTKARLLWSVPVGTLVGLLSAAPSWMIPACVVAAFLALILVGHAPYQDLGTMPVGYSGRGNRNEWICFWLPVSDDGPQWKKTLIDAIGLSVVGAFRLAVMVAPVLWWEPGAAWMIAGGALHGLSYWIGHRARGVIFGLVSSGSEWGEFCWGLSQGVLLCLFLPS